MPSALLLWPLSLLLTLTALSSVVQATVFSNSLQSCLEQCVDRNLAIPLTSGALRWRAADFSDCDYSCHIDSCHTGCKDLEQLETTCDDRCSGTKAPDSCFQGCHAVSNIFLHQIQYLLNHVTVEAKLDSLRGIVLSWSFGDSFTLTLQEIGAANIQWHAQSRVHLNQLKEGAGWKWTEFPPGSFKETASEVDVAVPLEDHPEIEVRLAAVWRDKTVVSRTFLQTVSGSTAAPRKPQLLAQVQLTWNSFFVCWQSDSAHVSKYHVQLQSTEGDAVRAFETVSQCHLFREVRTQEDSPDSFSVAIWEVGEDGKGSGKAVESERLVVEVKLKKLEQKKQEDTVLVFTNGTAILKMPDTRDFLMLADIGVIPFVVTTGQEISALSTIARNRLVVGLTDGSIYSLKFQPSAKSEENALDMLADNSTNVETFESEQSLIRDPDGTAIAQLVVDSIQRQVYAVRNQSGLIRCGFRDCLNATVLTTNSISYIERIAVDSWNGYLYYTTASGDLFIATLFPTDSPSTYSFNIQRRLAQVPILTSMQVEFSSQRLVVALKNGSLVAMDLFDQQVRPFKHDKLPEGSRYASVSKSVVVDNHFFWVATDCGDDHDWPSCLYGEETDPETGSVHLNRYLFPGKVVDLAIMEDPLYPTYLPAPAEISLTMTGNSGRATWLPPNSLPFQAPGSMWRRLHYEYKFLDTASGVELEHARTHDTSVFLKTSLVPSVNYTLLVQACIDRRDGHRDDFHGCSRTPAAALTVESPSGLAKGNTLPSVIIYSDADGSAVESLPSMNLLGVEFGNDGSDYPQLPSSSPEVITFDNATKSLYTASHTEISIFRVYPTKLRYRFMDYLSVTFMATLPSRALIIISSAYQIVQYRLAATYDRVIYHCGHQDCAEVVGLAADDAGGRIFYLLQSPNGNVTLFEFNTDQLVSTQIASTTRFPIPKQLVFAEGQFAFVTVDGRVGTFTVASLGAVQFNFALKNVRQILAAISTEDQRIAFDGSIESGAPTSPLLQWKMNKLLEPGSVVYKIQLYKDRLGGERTVDLALNYSYSILSDVLDKWPSQQHYDAIIDAITPWTVVSLNATDLMAPTKPPSTPLNPKIFVTQQKTVDGARAIIDVFWDEPAEWNGEMLGYVVNCSITDGSQKTTNLVQNIDGSTSRTFSFSVKSGKVGCAVAATNEQNLLGRYSDLVTVDSSDVRPLVRLFAIDSTNNLLAISNWSTIWDGVRARRRRQSASQPEYQGMAFVDNNLYAIRKEDSVQPFAVLLDVNNVQNVLHKVQLNSEFSQVDAVASDWVANRLLFVAGHDVFQIVLDTFDSLSIVTPQKVATLSSGAQDTKQLLIDPFANNAFLLTKNGSLFLLDLAQGTEQNLALSLDCIKSETVTSMTTDFKWNRAASPVIYALTWNGLIAIDYMKRTCTDIGVQWDKFGEKGLKSVLSVSMADKLFVFGTASELIIYDHTTATPVSIPTQNSPLKQILALSQSSQPYPERTCFQLPSPEAIAFNVSNEGRTGAFVQVSEPVLSNVCQNLSFPPTQYDVHFRRAKSDKVKHFRSISNNIHIENGILDKETDYDVYVSWFNRYYAYKDAFSEIKPLKTGYGYPTAPRDTSAYALTPDTVLVYWKLPLSLNAPKEEIKYRILQQSTSIPNPVSIGAKQFVNGSFAQGLSDIVFCVEDPCQAKVGNLRPSTEYKFWITAVHVTRLQATFAEDEEARSVEALAKTFDIPGTLRLDNVTSDSFMLRWISLEPAFMPQTVDAQFRQSGTDSSWTSSPNSTFDPHTDPSVNISISNLRSSTAYDFRFVATYSGKYSYDDTEKTYIEQFFQPAQQGRTKAGTPSAPINVEITKEHAYWILKWSDPENDGGAPIISYAVEYRPNRTAEWEIAERGIPSIRPWWRLDKPSAYSPDSQFRVRAANSEGFGPYGQTEEIEVTAENSSSAYYFMMWIAMILVLAIIVICIGALYIVHKNKKNEKIRKLKVNKVITLDDFNVKTNSLLEMPKSFQNEIRNLPHVSRATVRIGDPLGHGSFGDVYNGVFQHYSGKEECVAVKTLKSCNSESERLQFIKEAIIMNNFDHPNIVKLLGVCLECSEAGDLPLLIIELMSGGDLCHFLRIWAKNDRKLSKLSLNEIFRILIDVARGCAYLEAHKHIHRDLATRNCLISSKDSTTRVTKISDFGLARDVYSEDYYRVQGDALLPIRWMAPESILDAVHTVKSDVWSFGVLCWEVLTLGALPYKTLSNERVLTVVPSGRRLEKPHECPDELFAVMESCWDRNPDNRPSFGKILGDLESLYHQPAMRSNEPFPQTQIDSFEASQISNSSLPSDHRRQQSSDFLGGGRFDKSGNRTCMPSHLRQRTALSSSSAGSMFGSSDRPDSAFSIQTETTTCDDLGMSDEYEIPRSQPTPSTLSLSSYAGIRPNKSDSPPSEQASNRARVSRV